MKRIALPAVFIGSLLAIGGARAQQLEYGGFEGLFDEPVTMSATGKPERVSDTPVVMDVITAEDIQRSGVRDIPTLLRRLPGIDIFHTSPGTEEFGMRGYIQPLASRVMVLINGRQVYFDGFGEVFWNSLPVELDEIRQIEVIRGPESALYGFNAVDGVINIVTFDPVDDKVNFARARVGNNARRDFSAATTQSLGDGIGLRVTVADDHAHDNGMVVQTPANLQFTKDPNRRSGSVDFGATLADGSRLGLEASHTDVSERSIAYNLFYDARIVTDSVKGEYTADTGIGRLDAMAYYNSVAMPWVQSQPFYPFSVDDKTYVAQVSDLFKIGTDDSFRLGLEGRHNVMDAGALSGGTLSGTLGAGSAMWQHRFSPSLSMVNAVRYDYFQLGRSGTPTPRDIYTNSDFDRSVSGFSVNSALIDRIGADDTLRLSFARGLRLPSLTNFGQVEHYVPQYSGTYAYGNPNLQPGAVYDYQLGWDHRFNDLDAVGRVNLFHEMTMSHIGFPYQFVNGFVSQTSVNSTGSVANGIELQMEHKAKEGLTWGWNYTFERLHEHYDWGFRDSEPVHKINVNLGYVMGPWEADIYGGYTSATKGVGIIPGLRPMTFIETIKGYTTLSPRIAWHATDNIMLELVSENLWGYRDTIAQRTGTSYYASVKISY